MSSLSDLPSSRLTAVSNERPPVPDVTDAPRGAPGQLPPLVEAAAAPAEVPHPHAILDDPIAVGRRIDELRRWRPGFPDRRRPLAALLAALVGFFRLPAEMAGIEANAAPRRDMADLIEEEQRRVREELDRAEEAHGAFEQGIHLARSAPASELALESRDPEQDRVAGVLIAYLVSTGFATVRTDELPGQQYRYSIAVDWSRLDAFAARLGLPAASRPD
jgi:hypothetical protein